MKEATPYVLFALAQTVGFIVWIVRSNSNHEKKIALMEQEMKTVKKENNEAKEESKVIKESLAKVSEALAVVKNTIDHLLLKELKTKRA